MVSRVKGPLPCRRLLQTRPLARPARTQGIGTRCLPHSRQSQGVGVGAVKAGTWWGRASCGSLSSLLSPHKLKRNPWGVALGVSSLPSTASFHNDHSAPRPL